MDAVKTIVGAVPGYLFGRWVVYWANRVGAHLTDDDAQNIGVGAAVAGGLVAHNGVWGTLVLLWKGGLHGVQSQLVTRKSEAVVADTTVVRAGAIAAEAGDVAAGEGWPRV